MDFNSDTIFNLVLQKEIFMSLKSYSSEKSKPVFEFLYQTNDISLFNGHLFEITASLNSKSKLSHKLSVDHHGEQIKLSKDNFHNITIKNKTNGMIYAWDDTVEIDSSPYPFYSSSRMESLPSSFYSLSFLSLMVK